MSLRLFGPMHDIACLIVQVNEDRVSTHPVAFKFVAFCKLELHRSRSPVKQKLLSIKCSRHAPSECVPALA